MKLIFCNYVVLAFLNTMYKYYQLSHGCQGDTEKYLTRENLYHPRHTCITRDVDEGNTGVSRVIQVFEGQIISPYHPAKHVITTYHTEEITGSCKILWKQE